jgi:hypothetical protein
VSYSRPGSPAALLLKSRASRPGIDTHAKLSPEGDEKGRPAPSGLDPSPVTAGLLAAGTASLGEDHHRPGQDGQNGLPFDQAVADGQALASALIAGLPDASGVRKYLRSALATIRELTTADW